MDEIKFKNQINDLYSKSIIRDLTFDVLKSRNDIINELLNIKNNIVKIENYLSHKINSLKNIQKEDINKFIDLINNINGTNFKINELETIEMKELIKNKYENIIDIIKNQIDYKKIDQSLNIKKIKITDNIFIDAVIIKNLNDAIDNKIYYIPEWNHFVFNINGIKYHGNIGIIYIDDGKPIHVKECWNGNECTYGNDCGYYHDPEYFQGSHHIRNYTNVSWMYDKSSINIRDDNIYRKIGSKLTLEQDIKIVNKRDEQKLSNQIVHDLLIHHIMKKYMNKDIIKSNF